MADNDPSSDFEDAKQAYSSLSPEDSSKLSADSQAATEMSPSGASSSDDPVKDGTDAGQVGARPLRWWPALVLLALMLGVGRIPSLFEAPKLPILMLGFLGPFLVGTLILLWWLIGSRASNKEKAIGFFGFLGVGFLGLMLLHPSLQGMPSVIFVIPTGLAMFAIGSIAMASVPKTRVATGLIAGLIGFGFWSLLQSEGTTGTFEGQWLWRWSKTAEQRYLESSIDRLAEEPSSDATLTSVPWAEFRGKNREGVISGFTIDEDWESNPPKEVWRHRIGPAWSSFSVAVDSDGRTRLYTQEQRDKYEAVVCLDGESGAIIWDYTYKDRFWDGIGGAGPRATPTLVGNMLYCQGAMGLVVALDPITGEEKWQADFRKDPGLKPPTWGFSSSPLVIDGKVIVHAGGPVENGTGMEGYVVAYDALDGSLVWKAPAGNHTYSSGQASTLSGVSGVLMVCNNGIRFLNPDDGSEYWFHEWLSTNYRVLQPLVIGSNIIFSSSLGEGTRRIQVTKDDQGQWTTEEKWTTDKLKPSFNDTVYYQGHLYGFDMAIFASADFETGEKNWKRGRYGHGQVLLFSDTGQLLVISEKGKLVLIAANPEKLDERASLQVLDGKTWNHPVLVGDRFFVRNAQEIACYQLPSADSSPQPPLEDEAESEANEDSTET